jgi:hypothetical protein
VGYFIQTALILTREALNPTPLILPEKTRWVPNLYARDKEGKSITQIDAALVSPDLEKRLLEPRFYLEQLLKNAGRGRSGTWEMIEIRLLLRSRYNTGPDKNKLKKPLRRDLRGLQERLGILALWWCSGRRKIFPFPEACKLIYVRSPSLRCHTIRFDSAFFEEWIDGLTAKHQVFSNQIHQFKERGRMSEEEFLEAVKLEKELTRNERELDQALEELKMTEEKLIESGSWREKGPHQEAFKTSTTKSFLKTDLVELLEGREISRQELSTIIATKEKRAEITQLIEILNRAQKTTKKREKKQSRRRRKRLEKLQRGKEKGTEVILFERPPEIEQEKPPRPKRHKKEEVEATQGEFFEEEESAS